MKNVFLALAFMLVGTFTFANTEIIKKTDNTIEKVVNDSEYAINYSVNIEDDICTVTVTITRSDGVVARGRATSHSGDCAAAEAAALQQARNVLAEYGF